jgi:histidyl-tRNA synthetase
MKDTLGSMSDRYIYFIENTTKIVKKYGFEFIETPIVEESTLFQRSVGVSSDIAQKEMYQFIDKGDNSVSLRPEGTAGVVRSFVQNRFDRIDKKHKFFYHGCMFRYERPQKGRLRQFHQFGVESFGDESYFEDVNIIRMLKEILDFFNIEYKLLVNSLGCKECITPYIESLKEKLDSCSGLCSDCIRRRELNPIRVFDCKNSRCQEIIKDIDRMGDSLCNSCDEHFNSVLKLLKKLGIEYEVDYNLVRGLDYYNRTAFEFVSSNLGAQNAVAGGGRYDYLVEFLDGRSTPAIGFAIGIERVLDMIEPPKKDREGYYFGPLTQESIDRVYLQGSLYQKDCKVTISHEVKSLKVHLKAADRLGARYCAVIGEDEIRANKIWIKDLKMKVEKLVDCKDMG